MTSFNERLAHLPDAVARHAVGCCVVAGALVTLSLAPFDLWLLGPLAVALFALATRQQSAWRVFALAWLFGLGLYGSGTSWVYVSIHDHGAAPLWLAGLLTALLASFLALLFALPFAPYGLAFARQRQGLLLALPACWVLGEWFRTWFLTGFPWLLLGYAHLDTPLAGWFPVTGVLGASFVVAFAGCALADYLVNRRASVLFYTASLCLIGFALQQITWTRVRYDTPVSIGIVQPAISIEDKWNPALRPQIRQTMDVMSGPLWQQDVIVWPEAALPELYDDARPFLDTLDAHGRATHTALIAGIPFYDLQASRAAHRDVYYNSIVALGDGSGIYHKRHLVPFGEYVPFERQLRGLIAAFDLPMSAFTPGPEQQPLLRAGRWQVAPSVCYEVVYPDAVARQAEGADFLVTASNDSWFGHSIGPLQHFEIARARALETGRFLVRATNDGVSALVDNRGRVQQAAPRFSAELLTGTIYPVDGRTPFMRYGSRPLVSALALLLLALGVHGRRRDKRQTSNAA